MDTQDQSMGQAWKSTPIVAWLSAALLASVLCAAGQAQDAETGTPGSPGEAADEAQNTGTNTSDVSTDGDSKLPVLGTMLSAVGVLVAVWIAYRQAKQLRQLQEIGEETGETARKLKADTFTQEIVRQFFSLGEEREKRYQCVFPVYYDKRPLPFIVAGDYHALHVLQNLMGVDRLTLRPVPQRPDGPATQINEEHLEGNCVFLCTPSANPALNEIAPAVDVAEIDNVSPPTLLDLELPCWFAIDNRDPNCPKKSIWLHSQKQLLGSAAEPDYEKASALERWEVYDPIGRWQTDYGILLRATQADRKIVVMAGIHQYGTWIVGEFFRRITEGFSLHESEILQGADDFLAVVWGEFDSTQFSVQRCGVYQQYLWVRRGGHWERVLEKMQAGGA